MVAYALIFSSGSKFMDKYFEIANFPFTFV